MSHNRRHEHQCGELCNSIAPAKMPAASHQRPSGRFAGRAGSRPHNRYPNGISATSVDTVPSKPVSRARAFRISTCGALARASASAADERRRSSTCVTQHCHDAVRNRTRNIGVAEISVAKRENAAIIGDDREEAKHVLLRQVHNASSFAKSITQRNHRITVIAAISAATAQAMPAATASGWVMVLSVAAIVTALSPTLRECQLRDCVGFFPWRPLPLFAGEGWWGSLSNGTSRREPPPRLALLGTSPRNAG